MFINNNRKYTTFLIVNSVGPVDSPRILFLDFGSRVFFYRFLYVSFIPMSILITKMTDSGFLKKQQYRWIVAVFIISNLFQLFAAVYSLR